MEIRSYAKVNIFLKIVGKRGNYHEIASRFVKVNSLFDTIWFTKNKDKKFDLKGNFSCPLEKNTIYKAYLELTKINQLANDFFETYSIEIDKKIPEFAGLGGGSSNAAAILNFANQHLGLGLSKDELGKIGAKIGADVPFFVYDFNSANVSGIGEIVTNFEEESLEIETFTPQIKCETKEIFEQFRLNFYKEFPQNDQKKLFELSSKEIFATFDAKFANDLFEPALMANPKLQEFAQDGWFFSGSGSSFFRIK